MLSKGVEPSANNYINLNSCNDNDNNNNLLDDLRKIEKIDSSCISSEFNTDYKGDMRIDDVNLNVLSH